MNEESLYYATYRDGAFDDVPADLVYDVAGAVGARFGDDMREDVLDRYADHRAKVALFGAPQAYADSIASRSDRMFKQVAERVGLPLDDVDSIVADALDGRPFAFDRLMADYFGR